MGKIHILNEDITAKFAANELAVNRYYAIKELVDNSIDAGATRVEVLYDRAAGEAEFIVRDNGFGMSSEDLEMCYQRYATSKTNNVVDVMAPKMLGYRGEALYSLFQSSEVVIKTREEASEHGWCVSSSALNLKPCACEVGTEIRVQDFLSFIPARKASLSSAGYERNKISNLLRDFSIIRPDVTFVFNDGKRKEEFSTGIGDKYPVRVQKSYGLTTVPFAIEAYDDNLSINFIAFEAKQSKWAISINGRVIRSKKIVEMLQFFLKNNYGIERANVTLIMNVFDSENINFHSCPYKENLFLSKKIIQSLEKVLQLNTFNKKEFWKTPSEINANIELETVSASLLGKVIGQFDKGIILTEVTDGLLVIDQHAAYEKIIQEKLLKNLETRAGSIKQVELATPVEISDNGVTPEYIAHMGRLGFDIKNRSSSSYLLKMPYFIFPSDDLFEKIRAVLKDESSMQFEEFKKVVFDIANVSCKMAIKYGDKLTMDEMNLFVREMEKYPSSLVCNHGRPTTKKIPKVQLLKEFDRI